LKVKDAVQCIQAGVRGWIVRTELEYVDFAAQIIQASVRGWLVRLEIIYANYAALILQKFWRKFTDKCRYLEAQQMDRVLQAGIPGWLDHSGLENAEYAVTLLQSTFRSYQCRCQLLKLQEEIQTNDARMNEREAAAVKIQCAWRMASMRDYYGLACFAVITIQSWYRAYAARCEVSKLRDQSRALTQRDHWASCKTQTMVQGQVIHEDVELFHLAAAMIQIHYRRYCCQNQYNKMQESSIVIQSAIRRKLVLIELELMDLAATIIQAIYRGYICHSQYLTIQAETDASRDLVTDEYNTAAGTIQRVVRGHIVREEVELASLASAMIQIHWRRFDAERRYAKWKAAVVILQAFVRRMLVEMQIELSQVCAVNLLISLCTSADPYVCSCSSHFQFAALVLQRQWRSYSTRGKYLQSQLATSASQADDEPSEASEAATVIESVWRMAMARDEYELHCIAILVLQSWYRRHAARKKYVAVHHAILTIQVWYRRQKVQVFAHRLKGISASEELAKKDLAMSLSKVQHSLLSAVETLDARVVSVELSARPEVEDPSKHLLFDAAHENSSEGTNYEGGTSASEEDEAQKSPYAGLELDSESVQDDIDPDADHKTSADEVSRGRGRETMKVRYSGEFLHHIHSDSSATDASSGESAGDEETEWTVKKPSPPCHAVSSRVRVAPVLSWFGW